MGVFLHPLKLTDVEVCGSFWLWCLNFAIRCLFSLLEEAVWCQHFSLALRASRTP